MTDSERHANLTNRQAWILALKLSAREITPALLNGVAKGILATLIIIEWVALWRAVA